MAEPRPPLFVLPSEPDDMLEVVLRPEPTPDAAYLRLEWGDYFGPFLAVVRIHRRPEPGDVEVVRDADGTVRVRMV